MSRQNVQLEAVSKGAGIVSQEIILDHSNMTDSTTTGKYNWTFATPAYALRLACVVETLEDFNVDLTVAVGIADAGNTWSSATTGSITASTKYKHLFPYGAATIITGAEHTTTAGESVHITLTHASDYTLVTTGKIKVKIIYLQTEEGVFS